MSISISAADANREFSRVLREVREGASYVVTSHGKPVAKIVPIAAEDRVRDAAMAILLDRLRSNPVMNLGKITRDEMHDDG
ncbi:MAG: type II toxin-antitoxin system prevent-host-death family antitoxin [Gemmatimonadales bacterium]